MPTSTYDLIATIPIGGSSSATVSNIPQSYKDLVLIADTSLENSIQLSLELRFNGDTGSNYGKMYAFVDSGGTRYAGTTITATNYGNQYFNASEEIQILGYSSTDKQKVILGRMGSLSTYSSGPAVSFNNGRWNSTSAVTSLTVLFGTTVPAGTSFYLYGVA